MSRVVVQLKELEALVPEQIVGRDATAWIEAPIAGEPLYRRMFQGLLGLDVAALTAGPGRVARYLAGILDDNPVYGLELRPDGVEEAWSDRLELPARGVLEADLVAFVQYGSECRSAMRRSCEYRRRPLRGAPLRFAPHGESHAPMLGPALGPVRLWLSDSVPHLLQLSLAALEGSIEGIAPAGRWQAHLLMGPRAAVSSSAVVRGPASVGEESVVEEHARLGFGAVVGRGCRVGVGAELARCIVLDGATVVARERLVDAVRTPSGKTLTWDGNVNQDAREESREQKLGKIVAEWNAGLPRIKDSLARALSCGDVDSLQQVSHQLAGSGGAFGRGDLSVVAGEIDRELRAGRDSDEVTGLVRELLKRLDSKNAGGLSELNSSQSA